METLERLTPLPMESGSHLKSTLQSKRRMDSLLQNAIFKDVAEPKRFLYPTDHALATEFEEQFWALVKEFQGTASTPDSQLSVFEELDGW